VTLTGTLDWPEIAISETADADADVFDAPTIAVADGEADDETRPEPSLATAPFFIEFDEPTRLDPERLGLIWELPPRVTRAIEPHSPLVALLAHLLPMIGILVFPLLMVEPPAPMPVQLVFEQPPPKPQPGEQSLPPTAPQAQAEAQSLPVPSTPVPPRPAQPPPKLTSVQPAPVQPPPPKPKPISRPVKPVPVPTSALPPRPREAPVPQYPTAGTSREGYLAYLATLTGQHIDLVPPSLVGNRRGETVLQVAVRRDGVIDGISILRSSGYADIDGRIEQMVAAVRRFPPVPDAFKGNPVELELDFAFPEALREY
jgi:TonB family protein